MAKSENNEVMYGARGRVGNLVIFKNHYGKTVISKVQRKRDNPVYSEDQQLAKERFREGVVYAKFAAQDQILRNFYRPFAKNGVSIYNIALADFCKPPQIKEVRTQYYQGNIGEGIVIKAIDNLRVVSVNVTISKPDGTIIETGAAVQTSNALLWSYTTTALNNALEGSVVKATATDTPGNLVQLEHIIDV